MLVSRPDIPIYEEVTQSVDTIIIGKKIIYFKEINSTNLYAKKILKEKKEDIEEGTIVISDIQKSGRGRKNRSWSSPMGGLWFSIILYPNIPPQNMMLITMASSISVAQGIFQVTGLKPEIKWPNDILINKKKVCGILTELDAEIDKVNYSIIGIGINVNNEIDDSLKHIAISLKKVLGEYVSRVNLLQSIIKNFDKNYITILHNNYKKIRDLWFYYSNIIGKKVKVSDEKSIYIGLVKDVDENGLLILDIKGQIKKIISGDLIYI